MAVLSPAIFPQKRQKKEVHLGLQKKGGILKRNALAPFGWAVREWNSLFILKGLSLEFFGLTNFLVEHKRDSPL